MSDQERELDQISDRLFGHGVSRLFNAVMCNEDGSMIRDLPNKYIFRDVYTMAEKLHELGYRQVFTTPTPPPLDDQVSP